MHCKVSKSGTVGGKESPSEQVEMIPISEW